jgi:CHAT domain-containing protein/Flp pilus assembly protein TadD
MPQGSATHTFLLVREPPRLRELPAGTVDIYEIELAADQYLCFDAYQSGVDVRIDVIAPGGRRLFRADSLNGSHGPESVHLVAEISGRYRLEVAAVTPGARGDYVPRVKALRPASPADRDRAAAQLAAAEARDLTPSQGSFWEAAAKYERALRLWQGLGDRLPQVEALHDLGRLYFENGRSGDALAVFRRSLALCRALRARRDEGVALNELGRTYDRLGDPVNARRSYGSALTIWRSRAEPRAETSTLINLGILNQTHGQSWQALDCFRKARGLAHLIRSTRSEVNALNGMGWVYSSVADWPRALDAHLHALRLLNQSPDRPLKSATLTQLGNVCFAAGEPEEALLFLSRALALLRGSGEAHDRAVILDSMGLLLQRQGADRQAMEVFRKALAIFQQLASPLEAADARVDLGRAFGSLRQPEQALAQYTLALQEARRGGDQPLEAVALLGLATVERDRGNLILALAHGDAALRILESLRVEVVRPDLQTSYLAWHETYFDLVIGTLMARHRQQPGRDFAAQAFARSEQSRARRLLDALTARRGLQADQRAGADPALLARWSRLTAEIDAQDLARRRPDASPGDAAAASRELNDLLDQLNELESEIRRQSRQPAAPKAAPDLDRLRRTLLDPGTILLEYYLDEPRSFLWAISSEGPVHSFELPGRGSIEARIRTLYGLLARSDPRVSSAPDAAREAAAREGRELSRILLGQVKAALGHKRLAIAASGALQYLAFAALPDPGGQEGPLARWHEVVFLPSLAVLGELRERSAARPAAPDLLAMLADPVFGPSDQRLRGTPAFRQHPAAGEIPRLQESSTEAEAILAQAAGGRVLKKMGFAATRELVTGGSLGRYRILHFATHGTALAERSELSAIVLSLFHSQGRARDGYLRAKDLARLDLPAELVVLSACETALGPEVEREGMFGLPQSFLAAGASRVLVSLWNVGDLGTAELMRRFYHHLLSDGLPAGESLHRAQMEMCLQPRWQDPYHWAGFVLQGDWR